MNEIVCPICRHTNRTGARFCAACGRELIARAAQADDDLPTRPSGSHVSLSGPTDDAQTVPARVSYTLRVGRLSDVGRERDANEDSLLALDFHCANRSINQAAGFFVVADGMGGHEGGEIASGMLVRSLARLAAAEWLPSAIDATDGLLDTGAWLISAIQRANANIYEWAHEAGYEMGTTVVATLISGNRALIAHVGDSRAYRINAAGIEQLTVDHSLVESLVMTNQISREEARNHPQANVIYRTVGDQPQVIVDLADVELTAGDWVLLCSDGLSGMLPDEAIHHIILAETSPQAVCEALVAAANEAGGQDNCSVIVIQLNSPLAGSNQVESGV